MSQRAVTKSDRDWYDLICEHGCVICKANGIFSPCSPHHIEGRVKEGCHKNTIGLCGAHHQTGGEGVAFHATGRKTWESKYGKESELLADLRTKLGYNLE